MKSLQFKTTIKKKMADTLTPVGLYLQFRDRYPHCILLESSEYQSKEQSFSFLCIKPLIRLEIQNNYYHFFYQENLLEKQSLAPKNFYKIHKNYQNRIKINYESSEEIDLEKIKKINGLYGYMAYDCVQYFEDISLKNKPTPAKIPLLQYGFYSYIIAINHFNDELLLIENLPENATSELEKIEHFMQAHPVHTQKFSLQGKETSNITNQEFIDFVKKGKQHCQRGDVFQMVLSRQFKQKYKGDAFNVYRALRSINPSPYLFFFDYGNFQLMGSSPEAQIKITNKKAIINPIAGTFRRTGNTTKDLELGKKLSKDEKENAEHVMLVDLARNDLSKHTTNVQVPIFKEVQYFSHVIHLVSTVEGNIKNRVIDIVGDTFPAGTLSGAPKYKAMQLINKYENQTRGFYGGAVGILGLENSVNLAIAIRSFVAQENYLYSQAGAGIVIDSDENKELQEVNNKLAALKKALILAEKI